MGPSIRPQALPLIENVIFVTFYSAVLTVSGYDGRISARSGRDLHHGEVIARKQVKSNPQKR